MPVSILAISVGASVGAVLRWLLGMGFNKILPSIAIGTLAANLLGGYIIGLAMAWLGNHTELSPYLRLMIITGFCGGLTTFSTFSAELAFLIQQGRMAWAFANIAIHVGGSLAMTFLGIASYSLIKSI